MSSRERRPKPPFLVAAAVIVATLGSGTGTRALPGNDDARDRRSVAAAEAGLPAAIRLASSGGGRGGSEGTGGGGPTGGGDPSGNGRFSPAPAPLSGAGTAVITSLIAESAARCGTIAVQFRIACLGGELRRAAAAIAPGGDYQEAKTELNRTARRLETIARNNRDRAQRPVRPAGSRNAYPAVRAASLGQATEQAVRVIQEAETRLLRSAESSERRRVHYQSIARSLGSTTRILRS